MMEDDKVEDRYSKLDDEQEIYTLNLNDPKFGISVTTLLTEAGLARFVNDTLKPNQSNFSGEYIKKDGELRVMNGTFKKETIEASGWVPSEKEAELEKRPITVIKYFDLYANGWRAFSPSRLKKLVSESYTISRKFP